MPDLNPDLVEMAVCGLNSAYVRQMMGESADGSSLEGLNDAIWLVDDMALNYEQSASADARIEAGVASLRELSSIWRTATSFADEGAEDKAREAMARADTVIRSLDDLGLSALC